MACRIYDRLAGQAPGSGSAGKREDRSRNRGLSLKEPFFFPLRCATFPSSPNATLLDVSFGIIAELGLKHNLISK